MTALKQYARLECPGLWRPTPEAQLRDVVVSFGDASLVMTDIAGRALSHWSLAAVARINPGERPALYTPSAEARETLEVADDTMIDAIETVRRAIARSRPRSGRVRSMALAASVAGLAAAAVWWVPEALVRHAVAVLPEPTRAEIGDDLVAALGRVSAGPCHSVQGERALAMLAARVDPLPSEGDADVEPGVATRAGPPIWSASAVFGGFAVIPDGVEGVRQLPGGIVLIGRALVEDYERPDVLAGHLVAARLAAEQAPPLAVLLREVGPLATAQLLTTGHLPEAATERYAETLLTADTQSLDDEALLTGFAQVEVASTPYAYARDVTGESVLTLIEGDPMRGRPVLPLLSDGEWVALQGICEDG